MTEQRILELAYHGALKLWSNSKQKLEENPNNIFAQRIEQMRWSELTEIETQLQQSYNTKEQ